MGKETSDDNSSRTYRVLSYSEDISYDMITSGMYTRNEGLIVHIYIYIERGPGKRDILK